MKFVGGVELPKRNDIMSTLEEQTIPQTVCWALMPIRLHRISFLNTVCNSMITPPDSDKNTSGRSQALQQLGLWKNKGSTLRWYSSASIAFTVDDNCIASLASRWAQYVLFAASVSADGLQGTDGSDKCLFNIQAYEVWAETDHNKIKFQWACLLCLLPCTYK